MIKLKIYTNWDVAVVYAQKQISTFHKAQTSSSSLWYFHCTWWDKVRYFTLKKGMKFFLKKNYSYNIFCSLIKCGFNRPFLTITITHTNKIICLVEIKTIIFWNFFVVICQNLLDWNSNLCLNILSIFPRFKKNYSLKSAQIIFDFLKMSQVWEF